MTDFQSFKYAPVSDYLLDSIAENYVYFASPEQLNDPFDCRVNIEQAFRAAIERTSGQSRHYLEQLLNAKSVFDKIQADIENFGVLSLTENCINSVMWSQYGNEHKGVCLMYKMPDEFLLDSATKIIGRSPVHYGKKPLTKWIAKNADSIDPNDPSEFAIGVMKRVLTVKSKGWKYEREYRVIRSESGPLPIPPEFLTQISFGLRTSSQSKDRVLKAVEVGGSNAEIVQTVSTESDFGLDVIEI